MLLRGGCNEAVKQFDLIKSELFLQYLTLHKNSDFSNQVTGSSNLVTVLKDKQQQVLIVQHYHSLVLSVQYQHGLYTTNMVCPAPHGLKLCHSPLS